MLDYYGSITLNKEDIDKELINSFKKKCYESYIKSILNTLRYIIKTDYTLITDTMIIY